MKLKDSKWVKWVLGTVGAVVAGGAIMLGGVMIGYPAISQLVGLAVAQSATTWNNVIDAAIGDAQTSGILGMNSYLFNGLTFDRQRGTGGSANVNLVGAITPADAYANPTTASQIWNLNAVSNGLTWDRMRSATADALASTGMTAAGNMLFNNVTFDRWRSVSAGNNTATTFQGAAYVVPLSNWTLNNSASAGTPSATKASGGGSVRHVATAVSACVAVGATAQTPVQVNLVDGAAVLRSWNLSAAVSGNSACINESGLNITGTAATAMIIQFAGATVASSVASVNLSGYSTP